MQFIEKPPAIFLTQILIGLSLKITLHEDCVFNSCNFCKSDLQSSDHFLIIHWQIMGVNTK